MVATPPKKKKIAYEKKYHNGGGCHFTGPPVEAGDDDGPKDYDLWYQSMDHSVWLPGPKGYVVSKDMEEDPANSFFMS